MQGVALGQYNRPIPLSLAWSSLPIHAHYLCTCDLVIRLEQGWKRRRGGQAVIWRSYEKVTFAFDVN